MRIERKKGKDLTREELAIVNLGRRMELGSKDDLEPEPSNDDWLADFFLLKDDFGKITAFAKVVQEDVLFGGKSYPVLMFSTLVSLDKGKGYGKMVVAEIERYVKSQNKTAFGFCETNLVPFYKKCGLEVLPASDNRFYYLEADGKPIASKNIVPGEVIVIRGKDGLMEKILAVDDKRVGVYKS